MSVETIVRKYYSKLGVLPRRRVILSVYLGLISLISFINTRGYGLNDLIESFLSYLTIGIVLTLIYLSLLISKVFNVKRVLGVSLTTFVVSLPAEIIFFRLTGLKASGLVVSSGFIYVVLSAFIKPITALLMSSITPLLTYVVINELFLGNGVYNIVLISLVEITSLLIGVLFITYVEFKGRSLSGVSPLKALRAFLNTWFTGDPESLEKLFNDIGDNGSESIVVKGLIFLRDGLEPIALIFPKMHYGPFKNVGSSNFIHQLRNVLEPKVKVFTFHTAGSHEHNLTSSQDAGRLATELGVVIQDMVSVNNGKSYVCRPYRVVLKDGWTSLNLISDDFLVMFVMNKAVGNDDIPAALWDLLEDSVKHLNLSAIVDVHAFKGSKVLDPNVLTPLVRDVVESYKCDVKLPIKVGYGEGRASPLCYELCDPTVKALSLNVGGERYGIIYVYGNNMDRSYRALLDKTINSLNVFKDFEIVTPDDHSCAASLKESPYEVVKDCPGLTKTVVEAVVKAVNNEVPSKYRTFNLTFNGFKYVGHKVFTLMESLNTLGNVVEKGLLVMLILANLIPILTYLAFYNYFTA